MKPWLDDDSLPPEVRRALAAGAPTTPLEGDVLARSRRRVAGLAAVPVAVGAFFWAQQFALGAGLGIAVSVGAAAAGGVFTPSHAPKRAPASAQPRAAKPGVPRVAAPNVAEASVSAAPSAAFPAEPSAAERRVVSAVPSAPAPESVTAEAALLEQARRAVAADPALALATLDEHARRFPHGALYVEREVVAVDALVHAGRRGEAEARADRLRATSPGSLYEARLRRILGRE